MKRQGFRLLVISSVIALAVVWGFAGSRSLVVKANIPFAFTVGEVSLPAGDYTITREDEGSGLQIRGAEANQGCLILTHAGDWAVPDGRAKLVFRRYGEQYFLSEMFPAFENTGQKLPVSKMEEEYIAGGTRMAAHRPVQPELVVTSGQ